MSKSEKASSTTDKLILVGDNAFQGVSHLSQDIARARVEDISNPDYCANLVLTALDNGADGFMFTVNQKMLSLLEALNKNSAPRPLSLYPIVPSAVNFIQLSGQKGMEGLAKDFTKELLFSGNIRAIFSCFKGLAKKDLESLMSGLLSHELSQIKSAAGKHATLNSVLLHELLTDMALALDLKWLFTFYIGFISKLKIKPGFETRNFVLFTKKFADWNLNLNDVLIVAPFNQVGFQMAPSRKECEYALASLSDANIMAINILASGYVRISEAAAYIESLPNMKGVSVGISKNAHAVETFRTLKEIFSAPNQ